MKGKLIFDQIFELKDTYELNYLVWLLLIFMEKINIVKYNFFLKLRIAFLRFFSLAIFGLEENKNELDCWWVMIHSQDK